MRDLKPHEQELIEQLINASPEFQAISLESVQVKSLQDGGMGSLRLACECQRPLLGQTISEYRFADSDGVEVITCLNLDQQGHLFELDIWKTDFSPLITWPKFQQQEQK